MKLYVIGAALLFLGVCSAQTFDCPRDVNYNCIEKRYPHPDCSMYYRCFAEGENNCISVVFTCPTSLEFSPLYQECVDPYLANCIDSTTVSTTPGLTPDSTTTIHPDSTTTPSTPPTPIPGPDGVAAFYATSTTSWHGGEGDMRFDRTYVNTGGCYKDETTFEPGREGVYFITFSAGVPARTRADLKVRPMHYPNYPSTIYRENTVQEDTDAVYRNFLCTLQDDSYLSYKGFEATVSTEASQQTSWAGFSLTDFFDINLHAFYAARETDFIGQGRIPMDRVYMDHGNNYNETGHEFIVPVTGVYYFFFGSGQAPGVTNRVALRTWGGVYPQTEAELTVQTTSHNGEDMAARGVLLELTAGERIWMSALEDPINCDDLHHQSYFGGFLYNPKVGPSVAWAVSRTEPWQSGIALDPMPFQDVGVNVGSAYDPYSNTVTITTTGYYYLEVCLGTMPLKPLDVEMILNGEPGNPAYPGERIAHFLVAGANHTSVATTGRGLIYHLEVNDVLRLRARGTTGVFSDVDKQTSWMGFLLYAYTP
ncbi:hypothetical protein CAPTEDRAFT_223944 [Capitella teleta]|uniref:C1q domain-containing protein n=1 Tax=Capitella teleta TaxID=283909 RepID=R7UBW6_CAPTE|nr:hypothetical protein CAPTEDRAFT_223944 [Capitella teleta]|eukprot:ELU01293.1 hypothetical protein CAPTEDRAFT_223944 [Capitella teleta]